LICIGLTELLMAKKKVGETHPHLNNFKSLNEGIISLEYQLLMEMPQNGALLRAQVLAVEIGRQIGPTIFKHKPAM
jgi:hypothetical protein